MTMTLEEISELHGTDPAAANAAFAVYVAADRLVTQCGNLRSVLVTAANHVRFAADSAAEAEETADLAGLTGADRPTLDVAGLREMERTLLRLAGEVTR